jgi:hypothetical protein
MIFTLLLDVCVHLLQVVLENTSESNEEGDAYMLSMKRYENTEGLRVYVGGQSLQSDIIFLHFPFGASKVVVEVYRGPNVYDYTDLPITLVWGSACQDDYIISYLTLTPVFLRPCVRVEFHHDLKFFDFPPGM